MPLALASTSFGDFELDHDSVPRGDQPNAIARLVEGTLERNLKHQTLLGVTGSGKTYRMANVIEQVQRPTLVIAHNKTLAAQLATEFQEYFPHNSVQYFVSYYDYYQPEAYIPSSDVYIEKETDINEEIDRLRRGSRRMRTCPTNPRRRVDRDVVQRCESDAPSETLFGLKSDGGCGVRTWLMVHDGRTTAAVPRHRGLQPAPTLPRRASY